MSSFLPSSLSSASLAFSAPVAILSACLPPVLSSTVSAALSMASAILSPCLSTASETASLALSKKLISLTSRVVRRLVERRLCILFPRRLGHAGRTRRVALAGELALVLARGPLRLAHVCHTNDVPPTPSTPIVAVVGATASGKTGLSLDLAERLDGEVVNTDAMQVYRGMDVGTAKLPPAERRGIPHHLLDTLSVRDPLTVAEFQARAREVSARLRTAGRVPVLVGGSALYTRAILDRFEFPGTDEAVRARLEGLLEKVGSPALHARLAE